MTDTTETNELDDLDNWHQTGCPYSKDYGRCSNADCNNKRRKLKAQLLAWKNRHVLDELCQRLADLSYAIGYTNNQSPYLVKQRKAVEDRVKELGGSDDS